MDKLFATVLISKEKSMLDQIENIDRAGMLRSVVIVVIMATCLQLFRTWWSLRHIPGPFLASITNFQRVWWVKTGRAHLYHQAVHAKYGDIVRIGPHMVSISNPEAIPTVYPIRPGFPKVHVRVQPVGGAKKN